DKAKEAEGSLEELIESLKTVQDDIGQICELVSEEKNFVAAYLESLLKIMRPLKVTISVSPSVLSEDLGKVAQASVDSTGNLIILYRDGRMELKDLGEEANRDLLILVIRDTMPKLKQFTTAYRQRIESRIKFLSAVTKELQKISKAFSTALAK
ncbi:MAG: hypothetical protein WCC63_05725, partial [Candidatus Bathyarchaeia archaeon]